jgi:hypothetical protein
MELVAGISDNGLLYIPKLISAGMQIMKAGDEKWEIRDKNAGLLASRGVPSTTHTIGIRADIAHMISLAMRVVPLHRGSGTPKSRTRMALVTMFSVKSYWRYRLHIHDPTLQLIYLLAPFRTELSPRFSKFCRVREPPS